MKNKCTTGKARLVVDMPVDIKLRLIKRCEKEKVTMSDQVKALVMSWLKSKKVV